MKDYKYWIAIEQAKGIGPSNLKIIYDTIKGLNLSIQDMFNLSPKEIQEEFSFNKKIIDAIINAKGSLTRIEEDYFNLLEAGVDVILFFEDSYPERLYDVLKNTFPPILYTYGNKRIFHERGAAILGEMNVSSKGKMITHLAARELAQHGIVTISGLAKGVDQIAHLSAVENAGKTIAILPFGIINLIIPEILQKVFDPQSFLIVSSFYPTREFSKFNAYSRNRLICALSYAVYIVESPLNGGIFEAGKSAHKQNIPLFITEYSKYPESASANKKLIDEYNAYPIKGRLIGDVLTPNLDKLIGIVKFT